MSEKHNKTDKNAEEETNPTPDTTAENKAESPENSENTSDAEVEKLKSEITELNNKYLRLYSEFDNYRKRTVKEKSDLIKTAAEDVFKAILPVIDDLERAIKANEQVTEAAPIKDGISLIYNKLKNSCQQKGLVPFESAGADFNSDVMEAITHIPAPDESQKGKVVDEIEKGYKLGDKVIRFAKVVVGN
ncbi:MAG: nucleotide exchange factor GrpE [Bacteroidia bacterium]